MLSRLWSVCVCVCGWVGGWVRACMRVCVRLSAVVKSLTEKTATEHCSLRKAVPGYNPWKTDLILNVFGFFLEQRSTESSLFWIIWNLKNLYKLIQSQQLTLKKVLNLFQANIKDIGTSPLISLLILDYYLDLLFLLLTQSKTLKQSSSRGLTSPHRCRITSFSQLKRISQSGQDTFFILFSLTFKAFVMFVTSLLFQSNLNVVLAPGKGPKNSVYRDLFTTKNPTHKKWDPQLRFTRLTVRG